LRKNNRKIKKRKIFCKKKNISKNFKKITTCRNGHDTHFHKFLDDKSTYFERNKKDKY